MSGSWIAAYVALWVVVLVIGLIVVGTLRQVVGVLEAAESKLREVPAHRPGGLPIGSQVPAFEAFTDSGSSLTHADLRGEQSVLLFLRSDCAPCHALIADLRGVQPPYLRARLVLVIDASAQTRSMVEGIDAMIIHQSGRELARTFESSATPHAFVIDASGTVVATGTPNTFADLRELAGTLEREEVIDQRQDPRFVSV